MNEEDVLIEAMFRGMQGDARLPGSEMASHMPMLYLLARRYAFGKIVELGVSKGFSTTALLAGAISAGSTLESYDVVEACRNAALQTMYLTPEILEVGRWKFSIRSSVEAAAAYEDGSVSLLFLDTVHTLEATRAELAAWLPKIHQSGAIVGHDYHLAGAGVAQAVEELYKATAPRFRLMVLPHDQGLFILRP